MSHNSKYFYGPSYIIKALLLILFLIFSSSCGIQKEVQLSGKTMGTTYRVNLVVGLLKNPKGLHQAIELRLEEINKSMSTYLKDSEISRFNTFNRIDEKIFISDDFYNVLTVAKHLYTLTKGAWDGTIKPLVNLWGFGNSESTNRIPEQQEINAMMKHIGFNHIDISTHRYLIKRKIPLSLDLASIAKGYAVDQIAMLIRKNKITNFLLEIGGEGFASGIRKDGKQWRVGINVPKKDANLNQVYKVFTLQNKAFATSGDYRIFFELGGKRFSHILDPRNGYPVTNGVVSVSILTDTCTFADGLATAVMVLGPDKGLELVNRIDNTECLIVVQKDDGTLIDFYSQGLTQKLS
jgi:thiamine biosynthesis lipoprotein